jgi:hypothetical protein
MFRVSAVFPAVQRTTIVPLLVNERLHVDLNTKVVEVESSKAIAAWETCGRRKRARLEGVRLGATATAHTATSVDAAATEIAAAIESGSA